MDRRVGVVFERRRKNAGDHVLFIVEVGIGGTRRVGDTVEDTGGIIKRAIEQVA